MLTIVNGDHLCVGVVRVTEIRDAVGFVVGLVGMNAAAMHLMMSAYLNLLYMVIG